MATRRKLRSRPRAQIVRDSSRENILAKIFTVYSWTVKRGHGQEFVKAWRGFARWAISQTGSSGSRRLFRDTGDPTHFMSVDSWQHQALLESMQKGVEYDRRVDDLGA